MNKNSNTTQPAGHTPGKWRAGETLVKRRGKFEPAHAVFSVETGQCVCVTTPSAPIARDARRDAANARLIAAAPELLEALRASEDAIMKLMDETADMKETEGGNACFAAISKARAALARATGGKP